MRFRKQRHHVSSAPGSQVDLLRRQALDAQACGQLDLALDLGRRYLARRRNDPGALGFLAGVHHRRGDLPEFLRYGLRSYAIEPNRKHLGLLYLACIELGRFDTAVELCENELKDKSIRMLLKEPHWFITIHRQLFRAERGVKRQARKQRREAKRQAARTRRPSLPPPPSPKDTSPQRVAKRQRESPVQEAPAWSHGSPPAVPVALDIDGRALLAEIQAWGRDAPSNIPPLLSLSDLYVKHDGITDRFMARFQFLNCRMKILRQHEEIAEYLAVGMYYQAAGDELIDGLVELWINVHTRAIVEFPPQALANQSPESATATGDDRKLSAKIATDLIATTLRKARPFIEDRLETLLTHRRHELTRAYQVLDDAHRGDLEAAAQTADRREGRCTGDSAEDTAKNTLREWAARRDHATAKLARDHMVRVIVEPIELRRLRLPALVCTVRLTRRQASSTLPVVWNPLIKDFEPVPCTRCGRDGFTMGAAESGDVRCTHCF